MCPSDGPTAQQDLQCVVNHFYSTTPIATAGMWDIYRNLKNQVFIWRFLLGASAANPRALWSLFYNMELCCVDQEILAGTPVNLYVTSDPTSKIVYDEAVTEVLCATFKTI